MKIEWNSFWKTVFLVWSVLLAWVPSAIAGHTCDEEAHAGGRTVRLAWDENSGPDLMGYRIYYRNDAGTLYCAEDAGLQNEYTLSGLGEGRYVFWVTAYDTDENESGRSNEVASGTAAPSDRLPPIFSNVRVSNVTHNSATITWTTDEPATSQVNYGPTATYDLNSIGQSGYVTSHRVELGNLEASVPYFYRVVSRDRAGNVGEGQSPSSTFTTGPKPSPIVPAISALRIQATPEGKVKVSWRTNVPAKSRMEYARFVPNGMPTKVAVRAGGPAFVTKHKLTSGRMVVGRTYSLRVISQFPDGHVLTLKKNFRFGKGVRGFCVRVIR